MPNDKCQMEESAPLCEAPGAKQSERRMADELVALRPMVVTLLAVEVAAGAIDTAQLADFLGDQQLARHIAFQAQEIRLYNAQRLRRLAQAGDQAHKLRRMALSERLGRKNSSQEPGARNQASGPALRTGPGGDFTQDFSDQDLDQAFSLGLGLGRGGR